MPETRTNLYEGMFLLSQQAVASDFAGALDHVRQILLKVSAEIVALRKWEERRLAYEVKGQKRGTYILAHFNVQSDKLKEIDRDCNLSDIILRAMVLRGDHIGEVEMQQVLDDAATHMAEQKLREGGEPASESGEVSQADAAAAKPAESDDSTDTVSAAPEPAEA